MTRSYYATCTGISGIKEISFRDNTSQCSAYAEVTCVSHTLSIGDIVSIDMGYSDNHAAVLSSGVVKKIAERRPSNDCVITIYDSLVKVNDYFIVAQDQDNPLQYILTSPEDIVSNMLYLSGVTGSYAYDATGFQCGMMDNPLKFNCVTAWSVIENLCRVTTWMCWVDASGNIFFKNRKPYIMVGDTSSHSFSVGNGGDITSIEYKKSDDGIRNRIVVYGKPGTGIQTTLQASSPYLPAGFYKTLVIAHEIIDSQSIADGTANYNLTMFNRLTEAVTIISIGDPSVRARSIVDVTEPFTGFSGDLFFVTGTQHNWSQTAYTTTSYLIR